MIDLEQHIARDKIQTSNMSIGNLSAAHALDYIVLRVNPGLISCEDLVTAVDYRLDNS